MQINMNGQIKEPRITGAINGQLPQPSGVRLDIVRDGEVRLDRLTLKGGACVAL